MTASSGSSGRISGGFGRPSALVLLAAGCVAVLIAVAAVRMTGEVPRPVTAGVSDVPPPMVLRDGVAEDEHVARGAASLAAADMEAASRHFADASARAPDAVEPQVGLALARWATLGPAAVASDLAQLSREYPDDPYVLLHIGLVQLYRDGDGAGREALGDALTAARRQQQFDLARRADDLLHPDVAPGYPPVVVDPAEASSPEGRALVRAVAQAAAAGDRAAAARAARPAQSARGALAADAAALAASATATFQKEDPEVARAQLERLLRRHPESDAARMQLALVLLWMGEREPAEPLLQELADRSSSDAHARRAGALLKALDAA